MEKILSKDITVKKSERGTILVVEDDQKICELISTYLADTEFSIEFAFDGEEAIRKAKTLKPALITLDILLPKKDGWDVISELKSDPDTKDIPVVIISVVDEENKGFALGASEYIVKPVLRDDLFRIIAKLDLIEKLKLKGAKIMVVDDDAIVVKVISAILKPKGFNIIEAYTGKDAIELAGKEHPYLILLDLMMPEITGFEVLNKLKNNPSTRDIPVVIVTAKDLTNEDKRVLNTRASLIIKKSKFNKDQFLEEITRLILTSEK
jgi:CheY-like chemotaxis protein